MRIFKKVQFLFFIACVCVINGILSFLIEPANGSSDTMWEEYYQEEEIDTVFIGSSLCSAAFDPYIFNERLGVKSFNMGTPMQALEQNITALETAFEEHQIDTVVIGMGFFVFQEDSYEEAELTFEKALARKKGGIEGFLKSMEYIYSEDVRGTEKSVNYWFPWIYNKENYSLDIIKKNVSTKITMLKEHGQIKNNMLEGDSAKGYRPYEGVVDYHNTEDVNSYHTYEQKLQERLLQKFESLLTICKENEADILVVNTPHPDFDVLSCYEMYEENTKMISSICEKYGAEYYDFSLAKSEIFEDKEEYYYDYEHLNYEGSQAFGNALCDFIIKRNNGEAVKQYFYTAEEYFSIYIGDNF